MQVVCAVLSSIWTSVSGPGSPTSATCATPKATDDTSTAVVTPLRVAPRPESSPPSRSTLKSASS